MVASLGGIRIVGFFPLAPDSSAPLSLSQLLNDTEDIEQFNLLPSALQEHTCALRTGQEALPSHGARSPQAIYLPGPMPELALPFEIPSGNSGYCISLLQSPKPASRACLTSADFLLRADWEVSVHTLRLKGCLGCLCRRCE